MIATRPIFKNFMIAGNLSVIVMKFFNVDAEFTVKLCGLGGIASPYSPINSSGRIVSRLLFWALFTKLISWVEAIKTSESLVSRRTSLLFGKLEYYSATIGSLHMKTLPAWHALLVSSCATFLGASLIAT